MENFSNLNLLGEIHESNGTAKGFGTIYGLSLDKVKMSIALLDIIHDKQFLHFD